MSTILKALQKLQGERRGDAPEMEGETPDATTPERSAEFAPDASPDPVTGSADASPDPVTGSADVSPDPVAELARAAAAGRARGGTRVAPPERIAAPRRAAEPTPAPRLAAEPTPAPRLAAEPASVSVDVRAEPERAPRTSPPPAASVRSPSPARRPAAESAPQGALRPPAPARRDLRGTPATLADTSDARWQLRSALVGAPLLLALFIWWMWPGAPPPTRPAQSSAPEPSRTVVREPPAALPSAVLQTAPLVLEDEDATGAQAPRVASAVPALPPPATGQPARQARDAAGSGVEVGPPRESVPSGPLPEVVAAAPPPRSEPPAAGRPPRSEPLPARAPESQRTSRPDPPAVAPEPPPSPPLRAARPPRAEPKAVALVPPPPEVRVERTVWHPSPERRLARVSVEGHRDILELREGDAVGTLVVEEIQPSGVVFLHGGARLRRRVGQR